MALVNPNTPHPELVGSSDTPMDDDNASTPHASSFDPSSRAVTVSSPAGSVVHSPMSRSPSAQQFRIHKNSSRSNSRQREANQMDLLKQQIGVAFRYISSSINQSQDETHIALSALSDDARTQYTNLQLLQTRLAKGESLIGKELLEARQALATLEGATHDEQERLKTAIAQELSRQHAQQQAQAEKSEKQDRILEAEVVALKAQFAELIRKHDAEWQQVLRSQEDSASELLDKQRAAAAEQHEKDRQAAQELLDEQNRKFNEKIQDLSARIDRQEKPSYTIPPTEADDGAPGPSNRNQFDPWLPPSNPDPNKKSNSTPKQSKGKGVDRGGNYQPPPPPPSNVGGDPDPDPSDHDDDDDEKGDNGRGRKGGRPDRNARKPSIPRDTSPRTRGILECLRQLSTPMRSVKNGAKPPYLFQGDDNQDVRNWLTACEDYFDRNPHQWENHSHRIVFALGKTKGNKVAPFAEKYRKVMGGIGGFTRDPDYSTWERFRQEIIKRYVGIEEERRALDEMDKIYYKGKIDTYLLLLENLNIKAGLSGIAWRVRVESKIPDEILRRLSHFSFDSDEEWMETLSKVGRQEEELVERRKLTKSLTTPHAPPPKRKRDESEKGFNTKNEKRGSEDKTGKGSSRWKAPRNNPVKNKNTTKDEHTDWKRAHEGIKDDVVDKRKKEKRCTRCNMDNHTWRKCRKPILVATTFAYRNRGNPKQPFKPRTSTLAVHQPPPTKREQPAKVNLIRREMPSQVWELSDTEMS